MRPLSPTAVAFLRALGRARGLTGDLSGPRDVVVMADEITTQPDAALVPDLLFAFGETLAVDRAAARAVARALIACVAAASPDVLLRLDEACRRIWWYSFDVDRAVGPRDVPRLVELADDAARIAGVLSFHPDGHVRENAVKELTALSDGRELPFLLI